MTFQHKNYYLIKLYKTYIVKIHVHHLYLWKVNGVEIQFQQYYISLIISGIY